MAYIDDLTGTPFLSDADFRECLMDIIVWYGEHTRDIENVVVKSRSLA